MRTMPAGKFKAQCLSVLDDVKSKRETVIVAKHGQPSAKLVPLELAPEDRCATFCR